tara:strand:+ start:48 stop:1130 length:1083 start_codon:yes stop_codon:yes gene_type:complete
MRNDVIHKILNKSVSSDDLTNDELNDLFDITERHRIKKIFIDAINLKDDARIEYREHAVQYARYSCTRDLKILSAANQLSEILEDANINFIFLKGTAFKKSLYKDSSWRDCRDIDFLVKPNDVKSTLETLFRNGYKYLVAEEHKNTGIDFRNSHQTPVLVSPDGHYLEVHYRITMENEKCLLAEDMLKTQNNHIAEKNLNLIHVTYHALVMNKLSNGLVSLIDIHYLLENFPKKRFIGEAKKYNLDEIVLHMIDLYEFNLFKKDKKIKKTSILFLSNELVHAGEALVGFKMNIKNIMESLNSFRKKYLGNSKNNLNLFNNTYSFIKYFLLKFGHHVSSVLRNPSLWIKRNKLKKFLKKIY